MIPGCIVCSPRCPCHAAFCACCSHKRVYNTHSSLSTRNSQTSSTAYAYLSESAWSATQQLLQSDTSSVSQYQKEAQTIVSSGLSNGRDVLQCAKPARPEDSGFGSAPCMCCKLSAHYTKSRCCNMHGPYIASVLRTQSRPRPLLAMLVCSVMHSRL